MSIFKRFFGEKEDINNVQPQVFKAHVNNSNIKSIGFNLQKRFSRGVQYNMKIVIRGDRNVGKSALLARLKGLDFSEQYIPTDEIEVACVHWNYKSNDDIVKVEVWDVVDKGRKKKSSGLKLENDNGEDNPGSICLDAEFLDVYKGANAVIIVLDITKSWTLNYVERELQGVPDNIPVLVLANHRDMGSHRTITEDQIQSLVESMPSYKSGLIKYWESSMKNGYGLIYIHKFFNIPFLQLQRDTLLKQLATNEAEMCLASQELEDLESDSDSLYDNFISTLKHPKINISQAQKPSSLTITSSPSSQINSPSTPVGSSQLLSKPLAEHVPADRNVFHPPQARPIPGMEKLGLYPLPVPCNDIKARSDEVPISIASEPNNFNNITNKKNIEEFVPEDQPELSSFLDDLSSGRPSNFVPVGNVNALFSSSGNDEEDDDDDDHGDDGGKGDLKRQNPMVSSFQDDIDINDVTNVDNCNVASEYDNATSSSDENVGDNKSTYRVTATTGAQSSSNAHKKTFVVPKSIIESPRHLTKSDSVLVSHDLAPSTKSHIELNSSDIDFLEQITSRKELGVEPSNEVDPINSCASTTKKKKKKHHKESANKDQQSNKKKRKSKMRSRDSSPKENNSKAIPQISSTSSKPLKEIDDRVVVSSVQKTSISSRSDRSDSLERFLND